MDISKAMKIGADFVDYEEYERLSDIQREANEKYLGIFENDLKEAGLKPKTIENHLFNVDFYINDYLLRMEPLEMQEDCEAYNNF